MAHHHFVAAFDTLRIKRKRHVLDITHVIILFQVLSLESTTTAINPAEASRRSIIGAIPRCFILMHAAPSGSGVELE